jgi:hypothetical protein
MVGAPRHCDVGDDAGPQQQARTARGAAITATQPRIARELRKQVAVLEREIAELEQG